MPSPTKPHFVVDAAFHSSKEVLSIPRRSRMAAVGAWTVAGAWSTDKQTDGLVDVSVLKNLGVTAALAEALVSSTLWEPVTRDGHAGDAWTLHGVHASAVQFTNWPKWQKTKAEWNAGRESAAERARRHRRSKRDEGNATVTPPSRVTPDDPANTRHTTVTRDASHSKGEKRSELSRELSAVGDGATPPPLTFPDHCSNHRHDPEPPRCNDCRRTREQNDAAGHRRADLETIKRVDAVQRRRNCTRCEGTGFVPVDPDDDDPWAPTRRCPDCRTDADR